MIALDYKCPACGTPRTRWRTPGVEVAGVNYCSHGCWGVRLSLETIAAGNQGRWPSTDKKFSPGQPRASSASPECPACTQDHMHLMRTREVRGSKHRTWECGACGQVTTQTKKMGTNEHWRWLNPAREQLELDEASEVAQLELAVGG